jgi:hypothetical protein
MLRGSQRGLQEREEMHTYIYGQCRRKKCHVCTGCARERHAPHSAAAATPLAVLEEQPAHLPRATRAHGALVRTASWCRLSPSKATTLLSRSSDGNAPSQPEVKKTFPPKVHPLFQSSSSSERSTKERVQQNGLWALRPSGINPSYHPPNPARAWSCAGSSRRFPPWTAAIIDA